MSGEGTPGFSTRAIHAGQAPDPATGAVVVPIYQTSTFAQDGVGKHRGYEYSRTGNPTRAALEQCIAALEGGAHGLAFASGMAAEATIMQLLKPGDHAIAVDDLYGGTYRLFRRVLEPLGISFSFVDGSDLRAVERSVTERTRIIWLESPTNPLLKLVDIEAVSKLAHARQALVVVDNTFMSPYFQRPLSLGADIVVHSATKYLGGHSDVIGGTLVVNREDLGERLAFLQNAVGGVPGPMDAWLVLRGLKTLAIRMREHDRNARLVAAFLNEHPKVARVFYPGLPSNPQRDLARKQMSGFGGMISFEVKGGLEPARRVVERTQLFTLAESLGGVESLIELPAVMTHASIPAETRRAHGVADGLVRISVGIEDVADLISDLDRALSEA
ncbi:MAG: cystathionine gamma-synthase [Chloroflexi bacterium]|nr:MAG: cystathionine gamma-synthase [Chloroflexota bacterium]TME51309.1 MAG: cystathionine gamma-synthase [Chloroflexota bacterium]